MTDVGDRSRKSGSAQDTGRVPIQRSPGKRTLVQARYGRAVQRHGAARDEDPAAVHAAAERGTAGGGGPLPHAETIQRAFGRHDVGDVQAHTGTVATEAATAMGAQAYATGNHVVFGDTPSLHTAAHEAAHVVQQRGGVQLKGGVGQEGDPYEQHADAVADAVVGGRSAEGLLDQFAGGQDAAGRGGAAVERKAADVVQRALLPKLLAPPAYKDGLSYQTITTTAKALPPAPKKSGADWTGAANKAARKSFKDTCGTEDQTLFDGLVSDARFLQPGEVHKEDYANKSGDLPGGTTYTEYDVAKYTGDPKARGHERLVVGATGKKYYTANHYTDFAEFD